MFLRAWTIVAVHGRSYNNFVAFGAEVYETPCLLSREIFCDLSSKFIIEIQLTKDTPLNTHEVEMLLHQKRTEKCIY